MLTEITQQAGKNLLEWNWNSASERSSHLICFGRILRPIMLRCQNNETVFKHFYKHSITVSAPRWQQWQLVVCLNLNLFLNKLSKICVGTHNYLCPSFRPEPRVLLVLRSSLAGTRRARRLRWSWSQTPCCSSAGLSTGSSPSAGLGPS